MSDNVALIREVFEAHARYDMDAVTARWAPDVTWDVSGYEPWPAEQTVFTGTPDILEAFGRFLGGVRVLDINVDSIEEIRPGEVLALYTERRRVGDGPEELLEIGILHVIDGTGTIRAMKVFTGHDRARAALGVG